MTMVWRSILFPDIDTNTIKILAFDGEDNLFQSVRVFLLWGSNVSSRG